jgi:CheY-like chemotaxis protein
MIIAAHRSIARHFQQSSCIDKYQTMVTGIERPWCFHGFSINSMQVPVYHHPSLAVLVDDCESFLRSMSMQLEPVVATRSFSDAHQAIAWLNEKCARGEPMELDDIHRIANRPERFAHPSVVVVDYDMPGMSGVEFCQAIAGLACKKILFTGIADEKIAIDAFNKGLIDRFIRKNDKDALEKLETEIRGLQEAYFAAKSVPLRKLLAVHGHGYLCDPAFPALVHAVSEQYQIVEHYLHPDPSGLLMRQADGSTHLMVVESEDSLRAHIEVALDNGAPRGLTSALASRRLLPWFHDGDGLYQPQYEHNWPEYCREAKIFKGQDKWYWAMFALPREHPHQASRRV